MSLSNIFVSPIHNYYGAVAVKEEKGLFYIGLDNHDGCEWTEIGKPLYEAFLSEFGEADYDDVAIWEIILRDGDWYRVFARTEKEAMNLVRSNHYDMSIKDFKSLWAPKIRQIPANQIFSCRTEDGEESKSAYLWARGEVPGLFTSNTYDC